MAFKFIATTTNGIIGTADQIDHMRRELEKINVPWNQDCVDVVSDGWVHKYEVVNLIDKALHTRIYRMRYALDEKEAAERSVQAKEKEEKALLAEVAKMRGNDGETAEEKRMKRKAIKEAEAALKAEAEANVARQDAAAAAAAAANKGKSGKSKNKDSHSADVSNSGTSSANAKKESKDNKKPSSMHTPLLGDSDSVPHY